MHNSKFIIHNLECLYFLFHPAKKPVETGEKRRKFFVDKRFASNYNTKWSLLR